MEQRVQDNPVDGMTVLDGYAWEWLPGYGRANHRRDTRHAHHDGHPDQKSSHAFYVFGLQSQVDFQGIPIFSSFINAAYEQGMVGLLNSQLVQ